MNKKLVILCPYPYNRIGSQRFRFEQYLDYIQSSYTITQLPFWSEKSINTLYNQGNTISKAIAVITNLIKRSFQLVSVSKADIVFIHRESIPIGGPFYEWFIAKILRKPIVFDFDDAIWKLDVSKENASFKWLKNPKKTAKIIGYAKTVIAGNSYLSNYAKSFNEKVVIIPTTIDTSYHVKKEIPRKNKICIGWTGSKTTIPHLERIIPILSKIKSEHPNVYFKVIGDENYFNSELSIQGLPWQLNTEIEDLSDIDIGIMPLPDDEWSKGKCGFKGLQYMSLGIPTIMSPVGVNSEIISHGENGYLASSDEEWIAYLNDLIGSEELRNKLGEKGRFTVEENYSIKANFKKYLFVLESSL